MFLRIIKQAAAVFVLSLFSYYSHAIEFQPNNYEVYLGDLDSDGYKDIYFHPKENFIFLLDDLLTPILLPKQESFVANARTYDDVLSYNSGANRLVRHVFYDQAESYEALTEDEIGLYNLKLLEYESDYYIGDFDGDGQKDLLLNLEESSTAFEDGIELRLSRFAIVTGSSELSNVRVLSNLTHTGLHYDEVPNLPTGFRVYDYDGDGDDDLYFKGDKYTAEVWHEFDTSCISPMTGEPALCLSSTQDNSVKTLKPSNIVGVSSGNFRVSESGSASYSINISLPGGVSGTTPSLGLEYDSQRGDSVLGRGWSLTGLDSISRCRSTLVENGIATPLYWDRHDQFCYAGGQLKLKTDSDQVREYELNINSQLRIRAYGNRDNPSYFTVEGQDGAVTYYGGQDSHSDARQLNSDGIALTWSISHVFDSVGNGIVYKYSQAQSGNDFQLESIEYAFENTGGYGSALSSPAAKVKINYESRPDTIGGYVGGFSFKVTNRIESILVQNNVNGELEDIRSYNLHYRRAKVTVDDEKGDLYARSYLSYIQECDSSASNANCLAPTKFNWASDHSFDFKFSYEATGHVIVDDNNTGDQALMDFFPTDVNGDGFQDYVLTAYKELNGNYDTILSYGIYDKHTKKIVRQPWVGEGGTTKNSISFEEDLQDGPRAQLSIQAIDYNADGKQDLAVYRDWTDQWLIYIATPYSVDDNDEVVWRYSSEPIEYSEHGIQNPNSMLLDANSDGLIDIVTNEKIYYLNPDPSQPVYSNTPYHYDPQNIDTDKNDQASVATINWVGFDRGFDQLDAAPLGGVDERTYDEYFNFITSGDFNGDGVGDVVVAHTKVRHDRKSNEWDRVREEHYYIATLSGATFTAVRYIGTEFRALHSVTATDATYSMRRPAYTRFYAIDVNADTYHDLFKSIEIDENSPIAEKNLNHGYEFYLNKGDGFKSETFTNGTIATRFRDHDKTALNFVDYNADGYIDLGLKINQRVIRKKAFWSNADDAFTSPVTDAGDVYLGNTLELYYDITGDGRVDKITYSSKEDDKLHIHENKLSTPIDVIESIENGIGGKTFITYEPLGQSASYFSLEHKYKRETTFDKTGYYTHVNSPFYLQAENDGLAQEDKIPVLTFAGANWLVTRVDGSAPSVDSVSDFTVDVNATSAIEYVYRNIAFQAGGRGMLGFAEMETHDVQTGVVTRTKNRQDWPFIGQPYDTVSYTPAGDVMTTIQNSYTLVNKQESWEETLKNSSVGTSVLPALNVVMNSQVDTRYSFKSDPLDAKNVVKNATITLSERYCPQAFVLSGDQCCGSNQGVPICTAYMEDEIITPHILITNSVENEFDQFGNLVKSTTVIQGGDSLQTSIIENDYDETIDYSGVTSASSSVAFNDGRQRSYAELARITAVKSTSWRGSDNSNALVRETKFEYESSGKYAGLLKTEILEPNDPEKKVTVVNRFDEFGNTINVATEAKNHHYNQDGTLNLAKSENQTRVSKSEYDATGRYINASWVFDGERDTVGVKTEEILSRNKYGSPTKVRSYQTDLIVDIEYDLLGREIRRSDNTGAWVTKEYIQCTQAQNCPAGAVLSVIETSATGAISIKYFDKLARAIREGTMKLGGDYVFVDTHYDNLGRVIRKSDPFIEGASPTQWTTNVYDLFGRVVKTTFPDGSKQTLSYAADSTSMTNDHGHTRTEVKNEFGELWKVIAPEAGEGVGSGTIEYKYNSRGQMIAVISHPTAAESQNGLASFNVSEVTYDSYDRKLSMDDADKGDWEYKYNAFGELVWQRDAKGQVATQEYDAFGRMLRRTDFTASGSEEQHTRWYFDGRTDTDNTLGSVAYSGNNLSAVVMTTSSSEETCSNLSAVIQCIYPTYDQYGRTVKTTVYNANPNEANLTRYETSVEYDGIGRVVKQRDAADGKIKAPDNNPDGYALYEDGTIHSGIENIYDENGFLTQVYDLQTNELVYELEETNVRGQVKQDVLGNGVVSSYQYYENTGRLKNRSVEYGAGNTHLSEYEWDTLGNLTKRSKSTSYLVAPVTAAPGKQIETFGYDGLNRLAKHHHTTDNTSGSGAARTDMFTYNSFGNMLSKPKVGNYKYGNVSRVNNNAGPHAVYETQGDDGLYRYHYDNNGNVVYDTKNGNRHRTFTYSSFDKPTVIAKGNQNSPDLTIAFQYGIDRSRIWRKDVAGNFEKTTEYLGGVERVLTSDENGNSKVEWKRYLGGSAVVTIETDVENQQNNVADRVVHYQINDHLGSTDILFDDQASPAQMMSFDPWGARRDINNWENLDTIKNLVEQTSLLSTSDLVSQAEEFSKITSRGFTGHEMLDVVGIIHMNGRIYDARIARFLQADPIIQAATETESLNRYSYVWNNPLNSIDPSGFVKWNEVQGAIVGIVQAVVIAVAAYICQGCAVWVGAALGAASAYISGARGGGILVGAVIGAVSGAGSIVGGSGYFSNIIVQGVVGGITSVLSGGSFAHGFRTGAITAGLMPGTRYIDDVGVRTAARMMIAGTISERTGGKFANGAASAAVAIAVRAGLMNTTSELETSYDTSTVGKENTGKSAKGIVAEEDRQEYLEKKLAEFKEEVWKPSKDGSMLDLDSRLTADAMTVEYDPTYEKVAVIDSKPGSKTFGKVRVGPKLFEGSRISDEIRVHLHGDIGFIEGLSFEDYTLYMFRHEHVHIQPHQIKMLRPYRIGAKAMPVTRDQMPFETDASERAINWMKNR